MGDVTLMQSHDNSPVFSEAVYAPEALLTEWLAVVFACMTSSLLFYHMTRLKTLPMDPRWAALFACSLICVSILYNLSATIPYVVRMNHQVSLARDPAIVYQLNLLKYTFLSLAVVTTVTQLGICAVIFGNALRYF